MSALTFKYQINLFLSKMLINRRKYHVIRVYLNAKNYVSWTYATVRLFSLLNFRAVNWSWRFCIHDLWHVTHIAQDSEHNLVFRRTKNWTMIIFGNISNSCSLEIATQSGEKLLGKKLPTNNTNPIVPWSINLVILDMNDMDTVSP